MCQISAVLSVSSSSLPNQPAPAAIHTLSLHDALPIFIGSYTIANLAPVMASAVAGSLVAGALGGVEPLALLRGIGSPVWSDYGLALLLGILCGLVGIALMRSMSLVEVALRHAVPWAALRPAAGGLAMR